MTLTIKRIPFQYRTGLPTLIVLLACCLYAGYSLMQLDWDPLGFATYDGHFSYQIALRFLESPPYLDVPAYRFQRLAYPLIVRILALGQLQLVPWLLIVVNIFAIVIGTWATEKLLSGLHVSGWYALVYGLYGATPFPKYPLGGWLEIIQVNATGFLLISLIIVPMSIIPTIAGLIMSGRDLVNRINHPYVYCVLLNCIAILFLPRSTFQEPAAMVRLTQGLMVSLLLYGAWIESKRILNYSVLWIFTNVLLIKGVA